MTPLYVHDAGEGFPLLFLHGFCETQEIWTDFAAPFAGEYRVLLADLPGFGKSSPLPAPFSIEQVGDEVASWLMNNRIKECIVVGHSLGGYVALALADRHRNLIRGLGLFHSTSFADSEEKKENRNKVIDFVMRNGVAPFIDTYVPGLFFDKKNSAIGEVYRITSQTPAEILTGYSRAMRDRPDRTFILRNREIPKFIIAGVEDTIIPLPGSRKMAEIAENCSYFEVPATGHMGLFETRSECQGAIRESIKKML